MFTADDFDGDEDFAREANLNLMDRTAGQRECYCTGNSLCAPCAREY